LSTGKNKKTPKPFPHKAFRNSDNLLTA